MRGVAPVKAAPAAQRPVRPALAVSGSDNWETF